MRRLMDASGFGWLVGAQGWRMWMAVALLASVSAAQAKLDVVATTPDLGAIAEAIGGKQIRVTTLAKPTEDPHFVDAKPSFIARLNRTDVLIEGGAQLEVGWLPPLVDGSRNTKIATGAPGRIMCSQGISLMEVPATLDRSQGDIHASGNPHFMTDPSNALIVARHIADAFSQLDSKGAAEYQKNYQQFSSELRSKMAEWERALKPFAGAQVVSYHNTWPYFARRFGLKIDLFLEPKPGIPPTPAHLAEVIGKMKADHIRVIIVEPYQNHRTAEKVAGEAGATVVDFAQYPGGVRGSGSTYISLMDYLVSHLATALGAAKQ